MNALPGIERPDVSVGGELEPIRHADVVGGDTLLRRDLGLAQGERAVSEDQSQGEGTMGLHSGVLLYQARRTTPS